MNSKTKKIIIIIAIILAIGISGLFIKNKQEANKQELAELKEIKIKLEAKKNDVFMKNGFTEEYYRLSDELTEINKEIQNKEFSLEPISVFYILFSIIFILIFTTVITTIFKVLRSHSKLTPGDLIDDHSINQMEKMVSMLGKVSVDMAKEINPEYKSLKCPNCGAPLTDDVKICEYCEAPLTKVVANKK